MGILYKVLPDFVDKNLKYLKHGKTTLESYRPSKDSPRLISISR